MQKLCLNAASLQQAEIGKVKARPDHADHQQVALTGCSGNTWPPKIWSTIDALKNTIQPKYQSRAHRSVTHHVQSI